MRRIASTEDAGEVRAAKAGPKGQAEVVAEKSRRVDQKRLRSQRKTSVRKGAVLMNDSKCEARSAKKKIGSSG